MKLLLAKRDLKNAYLRYRNIADEFSCGSKLAEHISLRLVEAKEEVNKAIRRVNELDPNARLGELK